MQHSQAPARVRQLEQRLSRLEEELLTRYADLGRQLLETAHREQEETDRLVDEIIAVRRTLARARHEIQCAVCMCSNTSDSSYCRRCGTRLTAADEERNMDHEIRSEREPGPEA